MVGGMVAGALLGFIFAPAGAALMSSAMAGASAGAMVGNLAGALLFPGHTYSYGARLNDLQISSSTNGSPYPWGYGGFRIGGQIIWSPGLIETTTSQSSSAKGGPTNTNITYTYTISFAAAFCQGPATVTRIWMDSRLVYDTTTKGAIADAKFDTGIPNHNPSLINTKVVLPTIYPGNQTQLPNSTIQAAEGINSTPAFRNTCYIVYTDLPLSSFGNRLPNIRGEISISTALAYVKDTYNGRGISGLNTLATPAYAYVDSTNRKAYIIDKSTQNIQQVNLVADDTSPLTAWQPSTTYALGDEILDSNGNVQVVVAISDPGVTSYVDPRNNVLYPAGPGMSGGAAGNGPMLSDIGGNPVTGWATEDFITGDPNPFGQSFHTPPISWKNVGKGPEAVVIAAQGFLNPGPLMLPGEAVVGQGIGSEFGIDPSGNLWQLLTTLTAGSTHQFYVCYDPNTFLAKFRLAAGSAPNSGGTGGISFARTKNGDFLYSILGDSTTCNLYVYNITGLTGPRPFTNVLDIPIGGTVTEPIFPTANPAGDLFFSYGLATGGPNGNYVSRLSLGTTGGFTSSADLTSFIGDGAAGSYLMTVLWNPVDSTLIGIAHSGRLVKIDPVTLTVLAISNAGDIYVDGGGPKQAYFTQSGMLPATGVLHGFRSAGGNLFNLVAYDKDLNRIVDTPTTNWFVNPGNGTEGFLPSEPCAHDYDAATDSLLVTCPNAINYENASYRVFINRQVVNASDLGVVVKDLLTRAGVDPSRIDVTAVTGTNVLGFPITQNTAVKALLTVLCQAFFFDIVERDFKLVCVLRGGSIALNVPENDLGLESDQHKLQETIPQENDLPKDLTVMYADPALDYQQGKALQQRNARVKNTKNHTLMELPLTMNADFAAQLANKALKTIWQERNNYDTKLWKYQYLVLDPSDVIQFTYEGMQFVARLIRCTTGSNLAMEITAVSEDAASYISAITGSSGDGFVTQFLDPVGPTILFIFDIPLLQDTDASPVGSSGYYWGLNSLAKGWPGAALLQSADGETWNNVGFASNGILFGSVFGTLAAPEFLWTWDTVNTLNVAMSQGTLASTTEANVLNGANAALVGGEVIQYQNAVLNANGTYTLSKLLRGRRGTEWECDQHTVGETFVALNGTDLQRNIVGTGIIGAAREYKAVTIGLSQDQVQGQTITLEAFDLRPYAPCQLVVTKDGSNNFSISWVRRTRIGGAWLDGTGTVPLSEASEVYDLEVLNASGTILRKVYGLTSPTYFYTAANALADFGTQPSFVWIRIYQVSAAVGKGFPVTNTTVGEAVLDFGGGADATAINGIPIVGTPTTGQVLEYNGTNWVPANVSGGGSSVRATVSKTTGSLANGASETGTLTLAKTLALLGATTDRDARVQLYATAAYRTADAGRAVGTNPTPGTENGIIADFVLTSALGTWDFSPPLLGSNRDGTPASTVYYRITNLGTTGTITVGVTYLPLET